MDGLMEEVRERILRKGVRWAEEFLRASDEAAGSSVSVGKLGDAPPERDSSPECVPPSPTAPAPASGVGRCYTKDSVIRKGAAGGTRAQPPAAARSLREASASVSRAGRAKRGPASSSKVATHYNDAFVRGRAGRVSYEPALPSVSNIQVVKGRAGRVSYEPALPSVSNVQVVRGRAGRVSYEPALPSVSNVQVPVLCHAPSSPTESVISLNVSRDLLEEGDDTLLESDQEQLFPSDVMSVDAALEQHPVKNVHDLRSVLSSTIADNKSGKAANVRGRRRAMADASVTPASKKVCEPRASRTRRPSLRDNAECPVPSREGSCSRSSHRSASPYRSSQGVTPQVPSDVERCRRVLLQSASQAQGSVQDLSDQCSPDPCHKEGSHLCTDLRGDFYCHCKNGWDGKTCNMDINECLVKNGGCSHTCVNKQGTYHCNCPSGYHLLANNKTCEDIDECSVLPSVCGTAECKNMPNTYECLCEEGYKYDELTKSCQDINECEEQLCEQMCVNTPGGYTCHCDGRGGVKLSQDMNTCEDILPCVPFATEKSIKSLYLGRMFSGTPVIRLRFKRIQPTRLVAEFDFRTFDPEGVLFFAGGHQDSSWIVLALRKGKLELQLKYNGIGRVTSSGPTINHGVWQKISVEELERNLVIKVNKDAVMKIAVSGDLFTLEKGLYQLNLTVGGIPFKSSELIQSINPRLDGCMRGWNWLNGEDSSIQETVRMTEKMQCFAVAGRGSFFPGRGFALFNIDYTLVSHEEEVEKTWRVEVNAEINPATDTGVLFALVSEDMAVPLSLALVDYHSVLKEKRQFVILSVEDVVVSRLEVNVCDKGHLLGFSVSKDHLLLTFDGEPIQTDPKDHQLDMILFTLNGYLQNHVKTYVGGLPDVPVTATPVTAFYHGCMTMKIQQKTLDLDEAVHKHNDITSHSCPPVKSGK